MKEIMTEIGGIFIGVFAIAALYCVSMLGYTKFKKCLATSRYGAELWSIAIVLVLSILAKFFVYRQLSAETILDSISAFLYAIYAGIGGVAFEGLADLHDIEYFWLRILYVGSSLYAGLMFVSIITAKASYEVYSYVSLRLCRERKKNVYVFTALTEDTFNLACSIKEKDEQNNRKYVIVFAGSEIPAFDKKSSLCRDVMANGFYYWSYAKTEEKSIAKVLHLNNRNRKELTRRFVVFAFAISADGTPLEEENMDTVSSDARIRMQEDDDMRMEYYILTKRKINYQAYDNITEKVCECDGKNETEASLKAKSSLRFTINVWNEANAVAASTINNKEFDIQELIYKDEPATPDTHSEKRKDVLIWSLGFGETSQAIVKDLYIQTASENNPGVATGFEVDAFDSAMDVVSGIFQYEHPYFACVNADKDYGISDADIDKYLMEHPYLIEHKDTAIRIIRKALIAKESQKCLATIKQNYKNSLKECNDDDINEMPFPIVRFNAVSCLDTSFLERIDKVTGKSKAPEENSTVIADLNSVFSAEDRPQEKQRMLIGEALKIAEESAYCTRRPDVIVIATGDDFRNIRLANAIINDIINEAAQGGTAHQKQRVVVYVRDKRNNDLLVKPQINGECNGYLTVCITGNSSDIYTYDNILEHGSAAHYVFTYDWITALYETVEAEYGRSSNKKKDAESAPVEEKNAESAPVEEKNAESAPVEEKNAESAPVEEKKDKDKNEKTIFEAINDLIKSIKTDSCVANCPKACNETGDKIANCSVLQLGNKAKDLINIFKKLLTDNAVPNKKQLKENLDNICKLMMVGTDTSQQNKDLNDKLTAIEESISNAAANAEKKWMEMDVWKKESNKSAFAYKGILALLFKNMPIDDETFKIFRLCSIEHQRWNRFHIADGWTYSAKKNIKYKQHDCITPYRLVPSNTVVYDVMNVLKATYPQK